MYAPAFSRNRERFFENKRNYDLMKNWKFCFTKNTKTTAEWFLFPFMINTCQYRSIWSADFLTYRWLDDYFDLYLYYLRLQFSIIIRQRSVNVTSIFCNFSEMKYRLFVTEASKFWMGNSITFSFLYSWKIRGLSTRLCRQWFDKKLYHSTNYFKVEFGSY